MPLLCLVSSYHNINQASLPSSSTHSIFKTSRLSFTRLLFSTPGDGSLIYLFIKNIKSKVTLKTNPVLFNSLQCCFPLSSSVLNSASSLLHFQPLSMTPPPYHTSWDPALSQTTRISSNHSRSPPPPKNASVSSPTTPTSSTTSTTLPRTPSQAVKVATPCVPIVKSSHPSSAPASA